MRSLSHRHLHWLLIISVNATVPAMLVWKRHTGEISIIVALLSAIFALSVVNVVILRGISIQDRKAGRPFPKTQLLGTVILASTSLCVTAWGTSAVTARNPYLDLAVSGIPIDRIYPRQKALVVELIRREAANSQEYERAIADAQAHPLSPSLYSADSFANTGVIHQTVDRLQAFVEQDLSYARQQHQAEADFRDKMSHVDPNFLASWDSARKGQLAIADSAERWERMWVSSVIDLYSYAEKNLRSISVKKGQLSFSDDNIETQFDELRKKSEALQKRHQDVMRELEWDRQQLRAKIALPQ